INEVRMDIMRRYFISNKLCCMKKFKFPLLLMCLFLLHSLPAAALTSDNPADKDWKHAPPEQKNSQDVTLLAVVSTDENLTTIVEQTRETVQEPSSPADTGYNLQAYNSNEVASKAVNRNIGFFSTSIKERFSLWLSRSGKYLEMMKEILRQKDVPENIVFLSLIESGFSPNAYSVAHAAGPWQFIASTAKRYGLEINWWKDERRDPVKSTFAAADYLKDLYGMFGSWNLAMAAYNAGEGRIQKAMKRSNADNYWELLGTKHIRPETKDYVPKFIAASLIANNPQDFGFDEIEYHEPLIFDEVRLNSPIDLSVAAECAGISLDEIKKLNPELRRWCTPPDVSDYTLKIPIGTKERFVEALASIPETERFTIERYTVKNGDTFQKIAKRTGIPVPVVLSLNSMEKIMPLKPGSVIYLPPKALYSLDQADRSLIKKASYRKTSGKKPKGKKVSATKNRTKSRKAKKI
ncbi:MAG: transglycosylase SLT domain-containing protein, partial [Thermodesulfovibrionales bacterium]